MGKDYRWDCRRKAQPGKLDSCNATKWRKLEPDVCIRLHNNKIQDARWKWSGFDKEYRVQSHNSTTLRYHPIIRHAAAARERRWKKANKAQKSRKNGGRMVVCPEVFLHVLTRCSKGSKTWGGPFYSMRAHSTSYQT